MKDKITLIHKAEMNTNDGVQLEGELNQLDYGTKKDPAKLRYFTLTFTESDTMQNAIRLNIVDQDDFRKLANMFLELWSDEFWKDKPTKIK
jgi:hypothetical protein